MKNYNKGRVLSYIEKDKIEMLWELFTPTTFANFATIALIQSPRVTQAQFDAYNGARYGGKTKRLGLTISKAIKENVPRGLLIDGELTSVSIADFVSIAVFVYLRKRRLTVDTNQLFNFVEKG